MIQENLQSYVRELLPCQTALGTINNALTLVAERRFPDWSLLQGQASWSWRYAPRSREKWWDN